MLFFYYFEERKKLYRLSFSTLSRHALYSLFTPLAGLDSYNVR